MGDERKLIQWHPAFTAAIQIEFEEEWDKLSFESEHQLSKKPMQIDELIIKLKKDAKIRKNIGRIFRQYNIIEYKSPEDNLSINDFYKVYAYTCFYQSNTKHICEIPPQELTITFVCSKYPREMLRHLQEVRGLQLVWQDKGIYYLVGDAIPIQLIITKNLDREENIWLQSLRTDLSKTEEFEGLLSRYEKRKHSKLYQAAMDTITRANWEKWKEERPIMCEALKELMADEFEKTAQEVTEKVTEEVTEEVTRNMAIKLKNNSVPLTIIVNTTGLSLEEIEKL